MSKLEELLTNSALRGVLPDSIVTVVSVQWIGTEALELTYKTASGGVANELLYREDEARLEVVEQGHSWGFDGDGGLFRLVSEAHRISLAHLFDPVLAVHTSIVDPLPHQITAVYESMLPRQPLRFLLADDPGAGKTIMAGLLIKELIARGDLERCLVVCPGSLAEQWQDELYRRFSLPFEILTNDKLEAARTGNWFSETPLVIARLDKLSRDMNVQEKLSAPDCEWDLVICDEAHKMSATFFGGQVSYTKRHRLGQLLSGLTRHFLLMTATPHNGKEADFQLFMSLLDPDRFESHFRDGVDSVDVDDLMRRMVKENLFKFDATPLFPERIAYTVPYKLSDGESRLYKEVTDYVRQEFNRAEALQNDKRAGNIGFALTILQRRLASSPEAIYQSLRRRKERLEARLLEIQQLKKGSVAASLSEIIIDLDFDEIDDIEDAPDDEVKATEQEVLDRATAAGTITELKAEIETLKRLEATSLLVRKSGEDRKWIELAGLLEDIFTPLSDDESPTSPSAANGIRRAQFEGSPTQKLVIFTEHRDTLSYLVRRISTLIGRSEAVVQIHGGVKREDRLKIQDDFRNDPNVNVLVATDAAGEGINLQRAHLMVNYDLPWNPNRIEQRFGRIHRIGQTEVCHLWNLVATETREGDVYRTLLDKLEEAREALGGQVFDVLGKIQFDGKHLRELLVRAIRYGEQPDVRANLNKVVSDAVDREKLLELIEDGALVHDAMDTSKIHRIREDMERFELRRLQPHYIESFFIEAFEQLGGTITQKETRRYQISNVPTIIRNRARIIGLRESIPSRYERITFEKSLVAQQGQALAAFVCPGHPLLDATIDIILERHRGLLRLGAVLVDENDLGDQPRVLFYLEHGIQDASRTQSGSRRVISKKMLYVEVDRKGNTLGQEYAPYLDYRPLNSDEPSVSEIIGRPECDWITRELEQQAIGYAVANEVPNHLEEVRSNRLELSSKTEAKVKERLTKEISFWDHRSADLKAQEQAGRRNAKLNSGEARKKADELQERLRRRIDEITLERQISPLPPVAMGGLLVIPHGLLAKMAGRNLSSSSATDKQAAAAQARLAVMEVERSLGFEPVDREVDKLGYDIESKIPGTGKLRFIEVKGRITGASTVTVTRNEILTSLNKPEDFILAIVELSETQDPHVHYLREPFRREPDFGVTSVNYNLPELLERAEVPS